MALCCWRQENHNRAQVMSFDRFDLPRLAVHAHTLSQLVPFALCRVSAHPACILPFAMSSITAMLRASGYRACLGTAAHVRVGVAGACVRAASSDSSASASTDTGHAAKGSSGLYPGHVRTSTLQKGLLAVGSAVSALLDPTRCASAAPYVHVHKVNACLHVPIWALDRMHIMH